MAKRKIRNPIYNRAGQEVHVLKGTRKKFSGEEVRATQRRQPEFADPLERADRMTTLLTVHYEHFGTDPVSVIANSSFFLKGNSQQPYGPRRATIEPRDTLLDVGWVEGGVGLIVIENRTGKNLARQLTQEEKDLMEKQVIYVRFKGAKKGQICPAGRAIFLYPEDAGSIILRAADKAVPVHIIVYPK